MRAVIYARYSTDMQSETSVEDQVRQCRQRAEQDGFEIGQVFSDYAISGSTLGNRPGMLSLMEAAKLSTFDLVYAEALDRISRDQEDIAGIYKRLSHADVQIVTLQTHPKRTQQGTQIADVIGGVFINKADVGKGSLCTALGGQFQKFFKLLFGHADMPILYGWSVHRFIPFN